MVVSAQQGIAKLLYRKVALERLSTPEQLDQAITLSTPGRWFAVLAVWALLAALLFWSVVGRIGEHVPSRGMLVAAGGGLHEVVAPAPGRLEALLREVGDQLEAGDGVVRLDQSELRQQLEHAREVVAERRERIAELEQQFDTERDMFAQRRAGEETALENLSRSATERRASLGAMLAQVDGLREEGLTTWEFMADLRRQYHQTDQEIHQSATELARLAREGFDLERRQASELREARERLDEARRRADELALRLAQSDLVATPVAGRVTEINAVAGGVVERGHRIMTLETGSERLEAIVFVAPERGKDIRSGMRVQVQPGHVRREEFGAMEGVVRSVSPFPMTPQGMATLLKNETLVAQFSVQGAPYAVRVELIEDPATPSGLSWTAGMGPPLAISPGTVAEADITIREHRPIALVIPLLRRLTGGGS